MGDRLGRPIGATDWATALAPLPPARYAPVMIAMIKCVMLLLLCALLAGAPARAQEQKPAAPDFAAPNFAALDAEVERGVRAYDAGDFATAKAILLPLAEAGHPWAMNMVGLMHKFGHGFIAAPNVGCDWYERAAKAGYPSAMYNTSICYDGVGRPNDPAKSIQWLLQAANHGVTAAMINLAARDKLEGKEYRHWMKMAAEHGSRYALVDLWLSGYEYDAIAMTLQDLVCVYWKILILDEHFDVCN